MPSFLLFLRVIFVILAYFFLIHSSSFSGVNQTVNCRVCLDGRLEKLREDLRILENNYVFFRWTERKIRWLYYEKLWQARYDMGDSLVKEKREKGKVEEEYWDRVLKDLEEDSLKASNGVANRLRRLEEGYHDLSDCSHSKDFTLCIQDSYQEISGLLSEMKEVFDHIFEHEREYRKSVELTASGRRGLYFQDALEAADVHTDFYWRFESDWEPRRFEEDIRMIEILHQAYQDLGPDFPGRNCCDEEP